MYKECFDLPPDIQTFKARHLRLFFGATVVASHHPSGPANLPPMVANPWSLPFCIVDLETRGFLCLFYFLESVICR